MKFGKLGLIVALLVASVGVGALFVPILVALAGLRVADWVESGWALRMAGLSLGLAYGGVDYEKQRRILQDGVDILIGTPGRLIDYFKQKVYNLRHVEVAVLDEADRMFQTLVQL